MKDEQLGRIILTTIKRQKTKFYAHFMITADGTIKVLDKEIEKAMEGIRVMGETKNKWRM